jgi:hypothetical protein
VCCTQMWKPACPWRLLCPLAGESECCCLWWLCVHHGVRLHGAAAVPFVAGKSEYRVGISCTYV